jgi:hypothetical protein
MANRRGHLALLTVFSCVLVAGCGSSSHRRSPSSAPPPVTTTAAKPKPRHASTSPNALQAEANSVSAGDIPDNQVFIVFRNAGAGYAMKYPEGWAQQGTGTKVTFRDKNNVVRVVVAKAPPPSAARIRRELTRLQGAQVRSGPQRLAVGGVPVFKVVYATRSAPNTVTGKRVTLVVDRYYLAHAGKEAVVDLGTPEGVDNVDAYRLMIESFRWQ